MSQTRRLSLEDRVDESLRQLDGVGPDGLHGDSLVVVTVNNGVYPTLARCFYAVRNCIITGTEAAGETVTLTPDGPVFFAFNRGRGLPPEGTFVLADSVPNRWTFEYNG